MTPSKIGRALVTGASSGIGRTYARALAARGYDLVITARRVERLGELAGELENAHGITVDTIPTDLSTPEGLETVKTAVTGGKEAPIDFLVHAAGFGTRGHVADLDEGLVSGMVSLHCLSAAALVRAALPGMIGRNRGRIVLVSSLGAFMTTAEYTLYSATKAFLNTFAIGLRDELAATEIRIQAICPGLVKTEFVDTPAFGDFHYDAVPKKYWLAPETVVDESLDRLERRYRPIIVPGFGTKFFLGILNAPLVGPALKGMMAASSRKRIKAGKPAMF